MMWLWDSAPGVQQDCAVVDALLCERRAGVDPMMAWKLQLKLGNGRNNGKGVICLVIEGAL